MSSTGDKAEAEAAARESAPSKAQPVVLLIDGHALVHRAYHALKDKGLSVRRTGEPTGATYGFTQTLLKALEEVRPAYWAIAFDLPTPTFRDALYAEYKAQRPPMPDELRAQMQRVRQIVEAFGVPVFEAEGFEADDVLGALSRQAVEQNLDVIILTGDSDITQLVGPHARVSMWSPYTGKMVTYDESRVRESYGVSPAQIADFKALKGDDSDNIPGVPDIGEVRAAELLQQFGSIEGIYQRIDELKPKLREKLLANKETLLRGKKLTTIVTDVPVKLDAEACRVQVPDRGKLLDLFRELEFSGLLKRLPGAARPGQGPQQLGMFQDTTAQSGEAAVHSVASETAYRTITSAEELERLVRELREARTFAIDTETTGTDAMLAELVGVSVSPAEGVAAYIPVGHAQGQQLPRDAVLQALRPLLTDASLAKVAHNANYDMLVLANCGVPITPWAFDTMIAAYLLGYKALDLKSMAFDRLNVEMTRISELIGSGAKQISMAQVPIERAAPYACADADITLRLKALLEDELRREGQDGLFADVEMPLVPVLVRMERAGVKLDESRLGQMATGMEQQVRQLETDVYNLVGHQFNLNSPKQLGDVLFAEMKLGKGKKTRTGYSTEASILEGLRGAHPVIDKILDFRQFQKLKSTYVDALPLLVNPRTGRVHTSYSQTIAATGRLSSSDPNLQNIPVRTEVGREVRKAFVVEGAPDWQLLSGDYSQIELRIVAHMSGDTDMIAAF
ncbi:MAG: DNA polymerase I, partial [Dehalococcoidia bacterium]|nr:DNA polymerase I [Dehalococcoidia bacterium]